MFTYLLTEKRAVRIAFVFFEWKVTVRGTFAEGNKLDQIHLHLPLELKKPTKGKHLKENTKGKHLKENTKRKRRVLETTEAKQTSFVLAFQSRHLFQFVVISSANEPSER